MSKDVRHFPSGASVGLLLLKHLLDLSDERVVEFWSLSACAQFFCGENEMQWGLPCEASELVHFRQRIGAQGAEKILAVPVDLHGPRAREKEAVADTTTQEKNITFPTDTKLAAKIVRGVVKRARENGIELRQSFIRTVPKLLAAQRGWRTKGGVARARKVARRLRTIAGQVLRQLDQGLPAESEERRWLEVARKVLRQQRNDTDKIYSLHEPQVYCLSKGKAHKKSEFGSKATVIVGKNRGVILGAYSLPKNGYDGHTLEPALAQVQRIAGYRPAAVIADRGYRGKYRCGDTEVLTPKPPKTTDTVYARRKARTHFRRRAAIEPRIGHLKSDHRVGRNLLKGQQGDAFNLLLASAASNLSLWMRTIFSALLCTLRLCWKIALPTPSHTTRNGFLRDD